VENRPKCSAVIVMGVDSVILFPSYDDLFSADTVTVTMRFYQYPS